MQVQKHFYLFCNYFKKVLWTFPDGRKPNNVNKIMVLENSTRGAERVVTIILLWCSINRLVMKLHFVFSQYVQKKHPMYSSVKEDTVWSFDRLQSYIDENYTKEKELPENWVYTTFTVRAFCGYWWMWLLLSIWRESFMFFTMYALSYLFLFTFSETHAPDHDNVFSQRSSKASQKNRNVWFTWIRLSYRRGLQG